jgi:regulator of replication initiation timing
MENQTETKNQGLKTKSNKGLIVALVIFLIIIIGLAIWLLSVQSNVSELKAEKEAQRVELMSELDSLMKVHEQVKAQYGELSDSLSVKDSIIEIKSKEIKKLMNTRWEYYKVKKKLASLQRISQGYIRQMDSLYRENKTLSIENQKIKEEIKAEVQKNKQLMAKQTQLTSKVSKAAILGTYNYQVGAVHVTGSGRERPTDKVKRVNKIKVCFTLAENKIAAPGTKSIYVRIAQPDKKILVVSDEDKYSFMFKGEKLQYSMMKEVNYQNQKLDVCMYFSRRKTQPLQTGLYHVDIFEGDENIGHAVFTLK